MNLILDLAKQLALAKAQEEAARTLRVQLEEAIVKAWPEALPLDKLVSLKEAGARISVKIPLYRKVSAAALDLYRAEGGDDKLVPYKLVPDADLKRWRLLAEQSPFIFQELQNRAVLSEKPGKASVTVEGI